MESNKSAAFLPKAFGWLFAILEVLTGLAAVGIVVCIIVDPTLPADAHFGPVHGEVFGQAADFTLQPSQAGQAGQAAQGEPTFTAHAFNGNVAMTLNKPAGLIALLKSYGLPLLLLYVLFVAALFDVLRRLFRNVGRGESFTPQTIRLVQMVGGSLIVFAIVSTLGEAWFAHATFSYLMQHTDIAVGGTPVRLPHPGEYTVRFGHLLPFGRAAFWYGLLVLALAEVFRQGLALKRDSDLTV